MQAAQGRAKKKMRDRTHSQKGGANAPFLTAQAKIVREATQKAEARNQAEPTTTMGRCNRPTATGCNTGASSANSRSGQMSGCDMGWDNGMGWGSRKKKEGGLLADGGLVQMVHAKDPRRARLAWVAACSWYPGTACAPSTSPCPWPAEHSARGLGWKRWGHRPWRATAVAARWRYLACAVLGTAQC